MKTLLVTGGAGFIGANFVRYAIKHDDNMRIIVLDALTYAGNVSYIQDLVHCDNSRVRFVHGTVNDSQLVDSLVSTVDTVVHFAAETHNDRSIVSPEIFYETNVRGTLTLLEAVRRYDVRYHHISTDEVYGDTPLDSLERFTEKSAYRPSSPYAASKAAADHIVRAWSRTYGVRATISNSSNNLGPYQHIEKLLPRMITNVLSRRDISLYGDGSCVRDWIHVEDHCSAIWKILQSSHYGETYVIGADCRKSNKEVAEIVLNDSYILHAL